MRPDGEEGFVLDANVFIQAKRVYYGLDFCPGFWDALAFRCSTGHICSIDRVWEELERGKDDLTQWARDHIGKQGFLRTGDPTTIGHFRDMARWVHGNSQYRDSAKREFQDVADGWLVAFAKTTGRTVVTLEVLNPAITKKVPIPNVCEAHGVPCTTTYEMLRRLGIQLTWAPPSGAGAS